MHSGACNPMCTRGRKLLWVCIRDVELSEFNPLVLNRAARIQEWWVAGGRGYVHLAMLNIDPGHMWWRWRRLLCRVRREAAKLSLVRRRQREEALLSATPTEAVSSSPGECEPSFCDLATSRRPAAVARSFAARSLAFLTSGRSVTTQEAEFPRCGGWAWTAASARGLVCMRGGREARKRSER